MTNQIFPKISENDLSNLPSSAEAKFYRACRDQLSDEIIVIHSLSLMSPISTGGHSIGECDFVIFDPNNGVLVVEVKGGGVTFNPKDDQGWRSIDRNGRQHIIKDPFKHSEKYRVRVLNLLTKDILKGSNISFPTGHSVAFPDINHSNLQNMVSHNRPREIILCAEDLTKLDSWYLSSVKYWNAKSGNQYKLSKANIDEICRKLLKPVHARPSLANDLNDIEAQRIKLTDEQGRLLQFLGGQTRANIIGGAGTGKTVIARQVSQNLASVGKKTALICYNRALGDNLKESAGNNSGITAGSFHSFFQHVLGDHFGHYFRRAKENFGREDEWDIVRPFAYSLFLEEHGPQFDAIVVDEAQDFRPDYWLAIEDLIRDQKDGSFYVFSDTNQKIFTNTSDIPQLSPDFLLFSNCRNTRQIHLEAYKNYVGPQISPPLIEGDDIEEFDDKSLMSQLEYLQKTLTYLIKEQKADPESIHILVANSQDQFSKFGELQNLGAPLNFQASEFPISGSIGFSTIKKFKGLEAPIVFLWGLNDLTDDEVSEMRYVGITRAKSLLYLVN